jgi:hypothetical protein
MTDDGERGARPRRIADEKREQIGRALEARGVGQCPACGGMGFQVADGYTPLVLVPEATEMAIDERTVIVPTVTTACLRCGHIGQHLLSALGVEE